MIFNINISSFYSGSLNMKEYHVKILPLGKKLTILTTKLMDWNAILMNMEWNAQRVNSSTRCPEEAVCTLLVRNANMSFASAATNHSKWELSVGKEQVVQEWVFMPIIPEIVCFIWEIKNQQIYKSYLRYAKMNFAFKGGKIDY